MPLDINQLKQLEQLDQRINSGQHTAEDCRLLRTLIASYGELLNLLKDPDTTLDDIFPHLPDCGRGTAATDGADGGINSDE